MEKVVPLIITPSDMQGKFLFSVPMALSSAGLEIWVADGRALLPGATELDTQTPFCLLRASDALKPRVRKE